MKILNRFEKKLQRFEKLNGRGQPSGKERANEDDFAYFNRSQDDRDLLNNLDI